MNDGTDRGRDWVALILAVGIAVAINLIVGAVLYDAIFSEGPGLSENATQVITGAFGGILGVLGAYIGFKAGTTAATRPPEPRNGPGVGGDTRDSPGTIQSSSS